MNNPDQQRPAPPSFNGRTPGFELGDRGSNPRGGANKTRMPRTVEELAALPEGGGFGVETYEFTDADRARGYAEINGARVDVRDGIRSVRWPKAPDVVSYLDDGRLHGYRDSRGADWKLGRYADGRWFRRRA